MAAGTFGWGQLIHFALSSLGGGKIGLKKVLLRATGTCPVHVSK